MNSGPTQLALYMDQICLRKCRKKDEIEDAGNKSDRDSVKVAITVKI